LNYRAGAIALDIIRKRGLSPSELQCIIMPAIGPKWLVLAGFDRALIEHGWLHGHAARTLLLGASVGAWRALALAARDPLRTHAALLDAYCEQRFTHDDDPAAISASYRSLLRRVFSDEDLAHATAHPQLDLAIVTARARGFLSFDAQPKLQALGLGSAAVLNALGASTRRWFFERVVFDTCIGSARHAALLQAPGCTRVALTVQNTLDAALASGTVPLYMQLVRDVALAPPGAYLDGGFSDYHVNRSVAGGEGIGLLMLHQRRIIPSWLDKFVPWRRAPAAAHARLLLVHPTAEFVRSLPGAAIPTRDDFERFVDEPEARIARWRSVAARSAELAATLLQDVESGAIAAQVTGF
jgi:hypothetical protein